ncbi:MAG: FprA family A-type flavoprotein, partial [Candidatus Aenigmatarchaeota archaeon]
LVKRKKLEGKVGGVFGSKGWSGGATRDVKNIMEELDWEVVEPVVEFGGMPKEEDMDRGKKLGETVAERIGN